MLYTQNEVEALGRVGITLEDALSMGLGIRSASDITRESLETRAMTGFPALTLEEENILGELRLENQKGGRLTGVDLGRDERTHLNNHYDGQDETPTTPEFLQEGDTVVFSSNPEVRRSRDGKTVLLVSQYQTIIFGIGRTGRPYGMIVPNRA